MRAILLLALMLYGYCGYGADLPETITVEVNDSTIFKGSLLVGERDSLYVGSLFMDNFDIIKGVFNHDFSEAEFRCDLLSNGFVVWQDGLEGRENFRLIRPDIYAIYTTMFGEDNSSYAKDYYPSDNDWSVRAPYSSFVFQDDIVKEEIELVCKTLYYLVMAIAIILLVRLISINPVFVTITTAALVIALSLLVNDNILYYQFLIPSLVVIVISIVNSARQSLIQRIGKALVVIVIGALLHYYNYLYSPQEVVSLKGGEQITLNWRSGSSLFSRISIRRYLNRMEPVTIANEQGDYTLYFNPCETTIGDYDAIMGYCASYFTWLLDRKPISGISFREAQMFLSRVRAISGITSFDLPTSYEWYAAANDDTDYDCDIFGEGEQRVGKGEPNINGLYDMYGNVEEYTRDYIKTWYMSESGTPLYSYDYIVTIGRDHYNSADDPKYDSYNLPTFTKFPAMGIRLIFRPDNIGQRSFVMDGVLKQDYREGDLPKSVILKSINGYQIDSLDYEVVSEKIAESYFGEKDMVVIDKATGDEVNITSPYGFSEYDLFPTFRYESVAKE